MERNELLEMEVMEVLSNVNAYIHKVKEEQRRAKKEPIGFK